MPEAVTVMGLGYDEGGSLPLAGWELLHGKRRLFLRTACHPIVGRLTQEGIEFETFDAFYEEEGDFALVYRRIAAVVCASASAAPVVYAVPGHPLVAEESVQLILAEAAARDLSVRIVPAPGFLDALLASLRLDPAAGLKILDGVGFKQRDLDPGVPTVMMQVYSRLVAGDVKLTLLERYPPEHLVKVVRAAGVSGEETIVEISLEELDRREFDHLCSVYLPPVTHQLHGPGYCEYPADRLVGIMAVLRGEGGCPWDREMDHRSLARYVLEEAYEVVEAIHDGSAHKLCEELGDLLLQIAFHARIAQENEDFDLNDVVRAICDKLVRRHPHVFGETKAETSAQVVANWQEIKRQERGSRDVSVLDKVGAGLSALLRASRVQERAHECGFDWPDYRGALDKVREELGEVTGALEGPDRGAVFGEVGDLLFAVVNLARLLGLEAEEALTAATNKFANRFRYVEKKVALSSKEFHEFTLEQLDGWWEEAKKAENP
ncbi:MAG TPA: nucleoside triphosphate pyrophosphohydrolase [Spirochaetia bacterium]|nr:nucleoside triphosphate pyrophosphohydrolase [Spirochaetia bacterium]